VGGSVAISNVVPGDGWFPAGTVVSVQGVGFNSQSRLRVDHLSITNVWFVSPTEMRFTLREASNLTAASLRIDNPDLSRATYYSDMRGIPAATSSRTLLSMTQPIFSGTTRSVATVGQIPAMSETQYAALALQNPGLASATVTTELLASDDTLLHSSTRSLQNGYRLALELSELFDGMVPPPGASVRVVSSLPIQVFGLLCDEGAWTITPWLPAEAATSSGPDAASDSRE
jgi:IPT/TIG domain